jgi:tetratricopeptide (TPR) repeat protein
MMRPLALALLGLLVQDPPADPAAEYKDRLEKLLKSIATKHVSVGGYLASNGMHRWARDEYNKAIAADPDCAEGRQKLGDKRTDDGTAWEADPNAKVKVVNDKKKDEDVAKIKEQYEKRLTGLGQDVAKEWYNVGMLADKAGMKPEAEAAFRKAIEYDAQHKGAREKLGYKKTKEGWVTAADEKLRKDLVEGLAKAPAGGDDKGPSEVGGKIGVTMNRRSSEHFVLESPHLASKDLGVLIQHAEHSYAMFHQMFGQSGLLPEKYTLIILKDKSQHEKYIDAFYTGDGTKKQFTRDKCAGYGGYPRNECFQADRPEAANMDYCIHYPVQAMTGRLAGHEALWLLEGMALWFTAKMKQTAVWACVDLAGTGTGGNSKNYQDPKNWPFVIRTWIKDGKDPAIDALVKCSNWAELDGAETVKAWSIVDFLIAEHKEKFVQLMADLKGAKDTGESSFLKVFGWSLNDLDARWRGWAKVSYEGK